MTPHPINYFDASIYKLSCRDTAVADCYVGSSINMISRRYQHKSDTTNAKKKMYHMKLYTCIRDNGGWDNWEMTELERGANDKADLLKKERYYIETLKASLNSNIPGRSRSESYLDNKEARKLLSREYYAANKDAIRLKHNCPTECECGAVVSKNYMKFHVKTHYHFLWALHEFIWS